MTDPPVRATMVPRLVTRDSLLVVRPIPPALPIVLLMFTPRMTPLRCGTRTLPPQSNLLPSVVWTWLWNLVPRCGAQAVRLSTRLCSLRLR